MKTDQLADLAKLFHHLQKFKLIKNHLFLKQLRNKSEYHRDPKSLQAKKILAMLRRKQNHKLSFRNSPCSKQPRFLSNLILTLTVEAVAGTRNKMDPNFKMDRMLVNSLVNKQFLHPNNSNKFHYNQPECPSSSKCTSNSHPNN